MTERCQLLFLDFETTGKPPVQWPLDADDPVPLEVGYALTDWDGRIYLERSVLIDVPDLEQRIIACESGVYEMHERSGLWIDLLGETPDEQHRVPLAGLDRELCSLALAFEGPPPRLAGFNPGFDYQFLQRFAPEFCSKIHYGVFDCSSLRELAAAKYGGVAYAKRGVAEHRGLADVHAAIRYLRWFRNHCMLPYKVIGYSPAAEPEEA
jgi:oligoribonuclease (3'-5' exoribonuclease)